MPGITPSIGIEIAEVEGVSRLPSVPSIASVIIQGVPEIGHTLTASVSLGGYPVPSVSYQWTRGGANIPGATGKAYTLTDLDDEIAIGVDVVATNTEGSDSASQNKTVTPTYPTQNET